MPSHRWHSAELQPSERKRGRRWAVVVSAWGPCLLPFVALAALIALRSAIVSITNPHAANVTARTASPTATKPTPSAAGQSAPLRYPVKTYCYNTCFKANDGVCDEGRPSTRAPSGVAQPSSSSPTGAATGPSSSTTTPRRQLLAAASADVEGNPAVSELLCDLGTDCADCGPWVGTVPEGWGDHAGPVAWSRAAHNMSLFVRSTTTPRPFLAAITHHKTDPDVSAMLWHYGAMEGGVTRVLHFALNGRCETLPSDVAPTTSGGPFTATTTGTTTGSNPSGRRRLVLDVGANFGYYSVQAALYGCRVVAFEPVRRFQALLEWSVHAAGVAERVTVVGAALGEGAAAADGGGGGSSGVTGGGGSRSTLPLVVPRDGSYWGLASVAGANVMPHEALETLTVNATSLDAWSEWAPPDVQPEDLLLVKLDIEGWEAPVLQGGSKLLSSHGEHVLMEYSPGIFERNNFSHLAPQVALPSALLALTSAAFTLAHLPTFAFAAPWPPKPIDPTEPLPPLEQITETALRHDLAALEFRKRMEVDPGGCPLPSELTRAFPVWARCREWMYGVHPKGFRSAFGFNTNVWAARGAAARSHMRLEGNATLFAEGQSMKVWTSQSRPGMSVGLMPCTQIGAGHWQLFRCAPPPATASTAAAVREAQMVAALAAEGRMPFTGEGV